MRYLIAITLLGIFVFVWQPEPQLLFWQQASSPLESASTVNDDRESRSQKNAHQSSVAKQEIAPLNVQSDEVTEYFIPNAEAVASMRQARIEGDPRTPTLGEYHERETPTTEELGDHEQYLEYERRQQKRVYRAYVEASKIKTARLREMIEKGKAEGISAQEIEFAEKKILGIESMAATLQQDYPDIMEDSYQPPADWLIENPDKNDNSIKSDNSGGDIDQ